MAWARSLPFLQALSLVRRSGLLYAPNSGAETRETVRKTSTDVKNQTVEFARQTIGAVKEGVQTFGTPQGDDADCEAETPEET